MGKAERKPRPSPPKYIWYSGLDDNCYGCKNRNACNSCKVCKSYVASQKKKRDRIDKQQLRKESKQWAGSE